MSRPLHFEIQADDIEPGINGGLLERPAPVPDEGITFGIHQPDPEAA
ncbi:hypothetical protein [uncultured Phycicoccus sp.]|nr:hypothetical protein [uncultured Phycicoccus sp.]